MSTTNDRIVGIDAARGTAMLFSCIAHFSWWLSPAFPDIAGALSTIGMIATPTFLILSGSMTGMLTIASCRDLSRIRLRLLDRGLFLLIAGHALVALAEAHRDGGFFRTLAASSIVDEIGLSMLIVAAATPILIEPTFSRRVPRTAVGILTILWIAELCVHPHATWARVARQALIGPDFLTANLDSYTAPTLQYVTLFVLGFGFGATTPRHFVEADLNEGLSRKAIRMGTMLALIGVACFMVKHTFSHAHWYLEAPTEYDRTLQITMKTPPSPAYLVSYGGVALILIGVMLEIASRRSALSAWVSSHLAEIGRASLFVFVLQYFLYWTMPDILGVSPGKIGVPLFFVNIVLMWLAAAWWNRVGGKRFMTIGIS